MASAGATEKEREFLRWKRKQDQLRAQQAEARRMEQQQRFAGKRREEKAMVPRRQPPRAYPATFLHQQQPNPPRKSTFYYDEDQDLGERAYEAQRRRHSVCDSVDSAAFADAEPSPSRTFGDDDDADTEEDELMRMIMEKERQEAEAEAKAIAATKAAKATTRGKKEQRFQVPQRNAQRPSAAVQMGEDFHSPVRPADSETGSAANGHAPFRGARIVTESHRYKQRSPVFGEQRRPQQQQQERPAKFVNFHPTQSDSDVTINQVDHELPPLVEDRSVKKDKRLQNEDDVWEHFLYGTSAPTDAADDRHNGQKQSLDVPTNKKNKHNIFREEISLSQSRSTSLDSGFPTTNESINITTRHQEGQSQPSGNYSNESIPNVSYSPPMSPAASSSKNSSARRRQSSSSFNQSQHGAGGGDDRNPDGNQDGSDSSVTQHQHLQSPTPAIFPFWSVAFLISCVVVGVSGFFIEDVMDLVGKFTKTASTLTLSKEEQKQMHTRLEQLQSEIHGFRSTASEIEVHSQKVFAEVKAHLDRMKSEREKQQEMIAKEMNDLRGYMLHMMSDMVEQERELIHTRLKHVAMEEETKTKEKAQEVADKRVQDTLVDDSKKDNSDNHSGKIEETTKRQPVEEQAKPEAPRSPPPPPPVVDVTTVIEIENPPAVAVGVANATLRVEPIQPPAAAALTRGEGVMLMSWELLLMLTAMSILGGFVGLRVRNMNRRKHWYEQRRIRRHIQAQLEQERAARILAEEEGDDEDDEDDSEEVEEVEEEGDEGNEDRTGDDNSEDWDDGATESSVETVSLMRHATGLTPNGKQRRAAASSEDEEEEDEEADGDGDDGSEDDGIEAIGIRERKTAERYRFVRDDADLEQSPSRRRSLRLEERVPRR